MKSVKKSRFLAFVLAFLLVISLIAPSLSAFAASQSIDGKTNVATWDYTSVAAAPDFPATSGYYATTPAKTNSVLQLFQNNVKVTSNFTFSTSSISNKNFTTSDNYWLITSSTKGFKDLVFNFSARSSGTGPRDFSTEWSTDGTNWTSFGTIAITSTALTPFGMALPAEAANQDMLYIRIIQTTMTSSKGETVQTGGTHNINNIQLYGTKDPAYTTPTVTVSPATTNAILDATPITLACSDIDAAIYYTTDGTTPATTVGGSTKLYSEPITALTEDGFSGANPFVIKAFAKSPTLLPSDVATFTFNQQTITSNADAKNLAAGASVWVKGIGTYLNGNSTLYIQDGMTAGSGLCIYKSGADFSSYVGKEIYVYGKTSPYYGLMEVVPDTVDTTTVVVRNASPTLPTPTKIMFSQLSDRTYEGMLVAFDTVNLVKVAGTTTDDKLYNHKVSQAGISCTLRAKGITASVGTTGSYVNIIKSIASYYNAVQLFSTNTADLVATAAPSVEFMTASPATGTAVPLNSKVTLATSTSGATITYSLNGGAPVTSTGNSADVTIDAFPAGKATITATASDGTYTTAAQTFTFTQGQAAAVTASPGSSAVSSATKITLSSATTGSTIVYSLYKNSYSDTDGVLVGTADQTYTEPITLEAAYFPVRIVAKATLANYIDSNPATFTYTAKNEAGGEKNYYGSIHAHTDNSDGQGTLAEANVYARDVGKFDFFILADHSNSYDKAPAGDSVANIGNLNTYNTTNQKWLDGKAAAVDATTSTFLCDYGYEMTWSGGPGHMNTFNTTGFVSRNNTVLNNKTNDAGMQAYYQLLEKTPGSITQFNHPGTTFGNFSDFAYYDPKLDANVTLCEVGNGEGAVNSGGYFQSVDQFILALDKGWHLAPTNNGDNHKKGWGTSNTCATVVYTNDFTLSGIYQAMRDRSVWATENRDLDVTYHLTDGTNTYSMGAILDAPPSTATITITAKNTNSTAATSNIASIQLISNGGKVVDQKTYAAGNSDVTYTYSMTAPAAGYYFAKITDNQGYLAVTAPIWLGSAPKVGITSVTNSTVMPVTTEALTITTNLFNNESTAATLKSISYTVCNTENKIEANQDSSPGTSIAANGTNAQTFTYTPTTTGTKTVNISVVITANGVDLTFTATSIMNVVDINTVSYVGLDASHGNEYVSGGKYPNSMTNMTTLAATNGVRVVQLKTSQDLIDACSNSKYKMIILNAPSRKSVTAWPTPTNYTSDEIAALKTFAENGNTIVVGTVADFGESPNSDAASPKKHMSELQNDILAAIGSTLRVSDDEVMDDSTNGGQPYRLYPTELNTANPLLQGVVSGQTYSQYSGATIHAVDPTTGERTTTLPATVSPLVFGFPTTYSAECDDDNFGYGTTKDAFPFVTVGSNKTDKGMSNSQGLYIPKYINSNSSAATNPEEKLIAASENVVHSNGKTSLVVVAGGAFMSNFEIQVTQDNASTLPYANYNLMDNLYKTMNPLTITSIADAKNMSDGTEVIIEATATSEVNTQSTNPDTNKGFFDCIYAQDATGGINLFPVSSGIKEGQKARFYGKITHYQGEVELTVSKTTIIDQAINKITPTALSTNSSMLPANTGLLVKTTGVVSNVYKDTDGTINQFTINDGSGPAIVFINGYITKGTSLPFITDGATVSVVGLASIGEVSSDSNMHPRLRVRDRAEIVNTPAATYTVGIGTLTGGSITADKTSAVEGDTVSLTITPDAGKQLKAGTLKYNDGTKDVAITGKSFTMPAVNVTVTAVFENIPYSVSIGTLKGGSITADKTSAAEGDTVSLTVTPDAGKQLKVGTLKYNDGTKDVAITGTSFTMPAVNVTVTAVFENISTGGIVLPPASTPVPPVVTSDSSGTKTTVTSATTTEATSDSNGKATATVTDSQVTDAVTKAVAEAAKKGRDTVAIVEIKVTATSSAKSVETTIPKLTVNTVSNNEIDGMKVSTPIAAITFDSKSLDTISKEASGDVKIMAAKAETASLSDETRAVVGDHPVYNFSVTSGGQTISQFGGDVTVTVPYTPRAGEDTNAIVIYYINAQGKPEIVSNCAFDKATGTISFKTSHFSTYAVGYNKVSFKDISDSAWYGTAIGFIAARGVTNGTGNGNFEPDAKLTRGQFLVMLMKAYDIKADENATTNFADAGSTYYTAYLAAAKRLGISNGVGNNLFAPEKQITRQEMFTLLYNALKQTDNLPTITTANKLTQFTDADSIAVWANDALTYFVNAGTVEGSNGLLNPNDVATRAVMAQVLYKLLA